MTEAKGLLHNAKRLTTKARFKRDSAAGIQADAQFSTALNKLTSQFPGLRTQLSNREALKAAAIAIGPAPDLTKSPERLHEQIVEYGRPTPQFMNSRSADLMSIIKALQTLNDEAWKGWANAQLNTLSVDPHLLQGPRDQVVKDKVADLAQLAARAFNAADFTLFKLGVDQVRDLISELQDQTGPEEVIARIEARSGTLSFADLADEEIDVLRSSPEFGRRVRLSVP